MGCQVGLGSTIGRLQVFNPTTVFDLTCAAEGAAGGNFGGDPDELLDRDVPILSAGLGICQATALGLFRHREWFGGSFSGFDSKTSE